VPACAPLAACTRERQKWLTPKEMQFSPRIADHDLDVKLGKVDSLLNEGYR